MDKKEISMLYVKDQKVEIEKWIERDDAKRKVRLRKYVDAIKEELKKC